MTEITTTAIEPQVLMERVRKNVLNKGIDIESKEYQKYEAKTYREVSRSDLQAISEKLESVRENVRILDSTWYITETPITNTNKLIILIKRCIRKSVYWILKPYWQHQTNFNGAATRAISDMVQAQEQLLDILDESH